MLQDVRKLPLMQQKLAWIADREKDGWEVVKCYWSHDLVSDSDNEKQLLRARREAASNKKKRKSAMQKNRKKQFGNATGFILLTTENPSNLSVDQSKALMIAFGDTNIDQKFVFPVKNKEIFNKVVPSKQISLLECELGRDWEYSENCIERISVNGI